MSSPLPSRHLRRHRRLLKGTTVKVTLPNGREEYRSPQAFTRRHSDQRLTSEWVDYAAYLSSAEWQRIRALVLKRDGGRCTQCGATGRLQVHHHTYERISRERLTDLLTVCQPCHEAHHSGERVIARPRPRPSKPKRRKPTRRPQSEVEKLELRDQVEARKAARREAKAAKHERKNKPAEELPGWIKHVPVLARPSGQRETPARDSGQTEAKRRRS